MDKYIAFDPSIFSNNLGDSIIMDYCNDELSKFLPNLVQIRLPTQQSPSLKSFQNAEGSKYKIVCGTNLLSSHVNRKRNQWKCDFSKLKFIKYSILMGVGWWQYQPDPDIIIKKYYQYILNHQMNHSVRDSYTEQKLRMMGFENVINTGCPTTWNLTNSFCQAIPTNKSNSVLFTITDYKPNMVEDLRFISLLCEKYEHVYVWPQGLGDMKYIHEVENNISTKIIHLGANLIHLRKFMQETEYDYIGTRLHAGICSLNHHRRTMIISVDNRAEEMRKDINLPVIPRGDLNGLIGFIHNEYHTGIRIKTENIDRWRNQFSN